MKLVVKGFIVFFLPREESGLRVKEERRRVRGA